ncbi:BRE [Branchiostoma lanceolatum]|uniref:BRISC and BRCA1-A complex member 2 n=1 Tax=Branchiostoma lanceolatum TaxID=7740 RepID=A0A8J9ZWF2_BRALA|nr:BRE [Branchiostoma lanceolatum]
MSSEHSVLKQLHPLIRPYVEMVLRKGNVGVCMGNLRISDVKSGRPTLTQTKEPCGDRFKIYIPFAGDSLKWEVIFDSCQPSNPPDFIFLGENGNFDPDIEKLENLTDWDPKNPESLVLVIEDLMREYRCYQKQLIEGYSRLQFEYSSLQGLEACDDVEVHMGNRLPGTLDSPVNFLIRLPIDLSPIPQYLVKDDPGEDLAVLLAKFHNTEGLRVTPQLFLSPKVEHALGDNTALRIPRFPTGGCLLDYVPQVQDFLQKQIDYIVEEYQRRREYVAAFISRFGGSVLEYDAESFTKLSLVLEWNEFFFVLHIELPSRFPQDMPVFTFQSCYHLSKTNGEPFVSVQKSYPYSPRWTGEEMAHRARLFILDTIPQFQKVSVSSTKL